MAQKIRIGSLDFDDVKASIKAFMQTQPEFTDYNFEGSGLSQIINLLAYNTHYSALNANFLANESFLDTAMKRSSVVSRAKELGYTPRSRRASTATLTVKFSNVLNAATIESLLLPRGSRFTTKVGDDIFSFTTKSAKSILRSVELGAYVYSTQVDVFEGILIQNTTVYNTVDPTVSIPNEDIDTSTLSVEVFEAGFWQEYSRPQSVLNVTATSKVYFLQEGFDGFELYFGDNIFGYTPPNTSDVRMTYVVTSGEVANGAVNFALASTVVNTTGATVTVSSVKQSAGGGATESIESIKLNSMSAYGNQNRAVVASDYASLTVQNFQEVRDCLAWDGSDNIPPRYGKVILSVQPRVGDRLTVAQKDVITSFLETKSVANTKIDFVDPEYVSLIVESTVRYDTKTLNTGTYELELSIRAAINNHARDVIQRFNGKLRYSNLVKVIDASNYAIVSNLTNIRLLKEVVPNIYGKNNMRFSFANELVPGTFESTILYTNASAAERMFLKDTGAGKINLVYTNQSNAVVFTPNIGLINYRTGEVQIDNLEVVRIEGLQLQFTSTPAKQDLFSVKNVVLSLAADNINVTTLPDY